MSRNPIEDLVEIHAKMGLGPIMQAMSNKKLLQFLDFRVLFLYEEVKESKDSNKAGEVVDAMIDIAYVAFGTLEAFGVDVQKAWDLVHAKNMLKEPGSNPTRPNKFGFPDMIKPEGWTPPNHNDNVGLLGKVMEV